MSKQKMSKQKTSFQKKLSAAPLSKQECESLWRWQHQMIVYYTIALLLMAVAGFAVMKYPDNTSIGSMAIGLIFLLAGIGAYVQFREKCPRCSALIGRQARFLMPKVCKYCGIEFPPPPDKT
jgi:prepilin signal peptidase PulO-like enzyme (type II secretory pathway)